MSSNSNDAIERLAAGVILAGFPSRSVPAETRELIARGVRSFILFARNVGPREQVQALTAELRDLAGEDAIVAIDHEGGRVNRLSEAASPWPSQMAWAAAGDLELVRTASRVMAEELAALGISLNLAPVADLLTDHRNAALLTRCASDDPRMVADVVAAFIDGHAQAGIGTSAKHFPGHGGTPVDSHLDLPRVAHSLAHLRDNDLVPFTAAIEAGVSSLMVSHVWYAGLDREEIPGTVSRAVVRLAREELGFQGPIITDSLEMGAIQTQMSLRQAAVRAMLAGCDLLTLSHEPEQQHDVLAGLVEAVEAGALPLARLEEANRRIRMLRRGATAPPFPEDGAALAEEIARRAVTVLRDALGYLPLRLPSGNPLGVVTFPAVTASGVENEKPPQPPLARAVQSLHSPLVEVVAGRQEDALERLRETGTVIVGTAFTTGHPEQAELVRALVAAGKRVIVLGLRDPFDLLSFPEAPCYLAAYDGSPPAAQAAADVIFGRAGAVGRLPVEIPGMYRRGHGLRRP